MNKIITIVLCMLLINSVNVSAQNTSAYEVQRNKVNTLLAERSSKFGQYDESLNARTGIFGFQTKGDLKNSNEILRQIALTDNDIFTQLKVLMDYKDLEVQQAKIATTNTSENIVGYRRSIKNLQDKNEELNKNLLKVEHDKDLSHLTIAILLLICILLGYLYYLKSKQLQVNEKIRL